MKYVDDVTLAESIDLPKNLVSVSEKERPQPDMFHARTGHILPLENSNLYAQLQKTLDYAKMNEMQINYKKTTVMIFNPCSSIDFMPEMELDGNELEVVEEIRLLGLVISSDMKWASNTNNMVKKANKKLWILRRLKF